MSAKANVFYGICRVLIVILTGLFTVLAARAQNAGISGCIVDIKTKQPVELASVSILNNTDSVAITGTLTGSKGRFLLSPLKPGRYLLKVISIGYQNFIQQISINDIAAHVSVDTIALRPANKLLNEVIVSSTKKNIANKLDKQVYSATQFEAAKSGNAVDVLKNLPSVSVNGGGEISVRGATGFLVLVNGKPVLTDAQTVLSQLPANSIENIELITAPSAKYDADGRAGIINITTKKGTTDGISLQVNNVLGLPSTTAYNNLEKPLRYGGDITFNLRRKKWDITLSANYTRNDANGRRKGQVYTKNFTANTITQFPSNGERSFDRYNYGTRASINFSATKNDVFNIGFFSSKKYQQRRADILYHNTTSDLTTGAVIRQLTYFNSNLQAKEGSFTLGSFDYTHSFTGNSKITAAAIYEYANLYGNTINKNLEYPSKTNVFQLVTNPYTNPISGYRLKLDYSVSIGKGKLETGYQYKDDRQNGNFLYSVTPAVTQPDSLRFSGAAKSSNQNHGLYVQYAGKSSRLQYIAGLRYEYAARQVALSYDPLLHKLYMNNLFPSVNLQYTFSNSWSAKAGYSRRVQRNNNYELNPIPEREHSETLEQGDPDLLPQFVGLYEIGINHSFRKNAVFATLYYQNILHPVQRVNSVYADTILNRLFTNAGKARLIGLEAGANVKLNKTLGLYFGGNIYSYQITGALYLLGTIQSVDNHDWVYSLNINLNYDAGKNWSCQANLNYLSERPTAQGRDSRFISPNLSLKKTFNNGRYSAGLQWQNINLGFINANQQRITTFGKDFFTTTNYIYETDVLLLNFSFNLNKQSIRSKLPASELGEKEF